MKLIFCIDSLTRCIPNVVKNTNVKDDCIFGYDLLTFNQSQLENKVYLYAEETKEVTIRYRLVFPGKHTFYLNINELF